MNTKKLVLLGFCFIFLGVCAEASAQTRIRFARGRTSATVSGTVRGNSGRDYVLAAREGQTLSANISSRGDCVTFGNRLTSLSREMYTTDNHVAVINRRRQRASFTLTVSIN